MNVIKELGGVYAALITPFDRRDRVNTRAIAALIDHHLTGGLTGVYVCGTTGQGMMMNLEERMAVAEAAVSSVGERGTVIVQVGAIATRESVELAQHAHKIGAHAVSSVPPIYYPVGVEGAFEHFRAIAKATPLPMLIYHVPYIVQSTLGVGEYARLFRIRTVRGMKWTDPNFFLLRKIMAQASGNTVFFSGPDELMLAGLTMGTHGSIGAFQNALPDRLTAILRHYREGDLEEAEEVQHFVDDVITICQSTGAMLHALNCIAGAAAGVDLGVPRAPIPQLSRAAYTDLERSMKALGIPCARAGN